MNRPALLATKAIETVSRLAGHLASWLIFAAILISAANALIRYALDLSSNAWLEIQWVLFSAAFLLGAGYTLQQGQHVRIDVFSSRLGPRGQALIDVFGTLCFLLPMCVLIVWLSWPVFWRDWSSGEVSSNAGGLPLWPSRLLVLIGFLLLGLQGIAELIKRWSDAMSSAGPPDANANIRKGEPS
ncbi:MAG: TRAP transporter small permease subunit [Betaproteobacteria bacterium]|nr:TRAP transporter small permease subunit [Betaproteobacteria bacterium]